MLKLCGFAQSNYYNKVKLALLEKEIDFEEKLVWNDRTPEMLKQSPLGKVPYFETDRGAVCESQPMLEYLEAAYPQKPLLPVDPYAAAKMRELMVFLELHLELVARELYKEAFFGGKVADEIKTKVQKQLKRHIAGFATLARFDSFIAGDQFTMADCAAVAHLPLISLATKIIYGTDMLAELPVREYLKRMGERPTVQKVTADRKANLALLKAHYKLG